MLIGSYSDCFYNCFFVHTGSKLEMKDNLMSQLQLKQRPKKKKRQQDKRMQQQDIYSHSALLNNLPGGDNPPEQLHPIQEGASPVEVGEPPVQVREVKDEVCVASFPAIISHEHFLSKDFVNRPYLTLVFTLMQYRQD